MVQDFFNQQYWKLFPYESLLVASSFSGLFGLPNSILQWTYNEHKVEKCWKPRMRYTLQNGTCVLKLITLGKKGNSFQTYHFLKMMISNLSIHPISGRGCLQILNLRRETNKRTKANISIILKLPPGCLTSGSTSCQRQFSNLPGRIPYRTLPGN